MTSVGRHRRSRRRGAVVSVLVVALAVAATVVLLTRQAQPDPAETSAALPEGVPAQPQPSRPEPSPGVGVDELLDADEISRLDPSARWRVDATRSGTPRAGVSGSCRLEQYADPRAEAGYVRTFTASGGDAQVAVQAVEVSASASASAAAFRRLVQWYAGCVVPRLQLLDSFALPRPGADTIVLELRRWSVPGQSAPMRSVTVALSRTGTVTTALVHEVDRPRGPARATVGRSVVRALSHLCTDSGGSCAGEASPRPLLPPATGEAPGFLAVVDLPPVAQLTTAWVGTEPALTGFGAAATLCDPTGFTDGGASRVRSRTFVLPREQLPTRFGIDQTTGVLASPGAAEAFVERAAARIESCPDRLLSASVRATSPIRDGNVRGWVARLTYELAGGDVFYRIGLVHHGRAVSQLVFSPTTTLDVGPAAFEALVLRGGQRLAELRLLSPGG